MEDQYVKSLREKLESYFKNRINDLKSTIWQAEIVKDVIGVHILGAYIEHIEAEHKSILNIKEPEKFAQAVVKYLNGRYNAEAQEAAQDKVDVDLTQVNASAVTKDPIVALKELQDAAVEVIEKHSTKPKNF